MPRNCAATLPCIVVLLSGRPTESLTVYRVGGAGRPPPILDHPFEFMPIRWYELNGRRHRQSRLIEIGQLMSLHSKWTQTLTSCPN